MLTEQNHSDEASYSNDIRFTELAEVKQETDPLIGMFPFGMPTIKPQKGAIIIVDSDPPMTKWQSIKHWGENHKDHLSKVTSWLSHLTKLIYWLLKEIVQHP